jgi:hypothetical protein
LYLARVLKLEILCSKREVSGSEHEVSCSEHEVSGSEHEVSCSEHEVSGSEHEVSCSEHEVSGSEHEVSGSEHEVSGSEHEVSGSEHEVSGSEHGVSCSEHEVLRFRTSRGEYYSHQKCKITYLLYLLPSFVGDARRSLVTTARISLSQTLPTSVFSALCAVRFLILNT